MKKGILFGILTALLVLLVLPFCGTPAAEKPRLTVVCATYPIYLFASSLAENVDGVAVERLDTGTASCLHDYTLSMADMKKLERADIIALNGAEQSMTWASEAARASSRNSSSPAPLRAIDRKSVV